MALSKAFDNSATAAEAPSELFIKLKPKVGAEAELSRVEAADVRAWWLLKK